MVEDLASHLERNLQAFSTHAQDRVNDLTRSNCHIVEEFASHFERSQAVSVHAQDLTIHTDNLTAASPSQGDRPLEVIATSPVFSRRRQASGSHQAARYPAAPICRPERPCPACACGNALTSTYQPCGHSVCAPCCERILPRSDCPVCAKLACLLCPQLCPSTRDGAPFP